MMRRENSHRLNETTFLPSCTHARMGDHQANKVFSSSCDMRVVYISQVFHYRAIAGTGRIMCAEK